MSATSISAKFHRPTQWKAIGITVLIAWAFSLGIIYGVAEYGIALFFVLPFLFGFVPVTLYGYKQPISLGKSIWLGVDTLLVYAIGLIVFAIEGLICIVMCLPIAALAGLLGSYVGFKLLPIQQRLSPSQSTLSVSLVVALVPMMVLLEGHPEPDLEHVSTSIIIDATPEEVWPHIIEFPPLDEPTELIFRAGIAYPTDAQMIGRGLGAVRHCNFTTGSFVEPITHWEAPHRLAFSVEEYPEPMKEMSFYDLDAPHLHDYFVSKQGQFELKALPDGRTELIGTTWYYHNIRPAGYWQLWSRYLLHTIHRRVLNHVKANVEANITAPPAP